MKTNTRPLLGTSTHHKIVGSRVSFSPLERAFQRMKVKLSQHDNARSSANASTNTALSLAHLEQHTGNHTHRATHWTIGPQLQGTQRFTRSHHPKADTRPFRTEKPTRFFRLPRQKEETGSRYSATIANSKDWTGRRWDRISAGAVRGLSRRECHGMVPRSGGCKA